MASIISSLGRALTNPYNIAAGVGTVASGGGLAAMLPLLGRVGLGAGVDYAQQGRQDKFNRRQKKAQARANLMQAVSPRGQRFEAPVDVPKAGILEKLGTAAQTGLSVADEFQKAKSAAQLRDLQLQEAEFGAGEDKGFEDWLRKDPTLAYDPGDDFYAAIARKTVIAEDLPPDRPWIGEGGTMETAFEMPVTEVSAKRPVAEDLPPGQLKGRFRGREAQRASEAAVAKIEREIKEVDLSIAKALGAQIQRFSDLEQGAVEFLNKNNEAIKKIPMVASKVAALKNTIRDNLASGDHKAGAVAQVAMLNLLYNTFIEEGLAVRKDDADMLAARRGQFDRIRSAYDRYFETGEFLTPIQVEQFDELTNILFGAYVRSVEETINISFAQGLPGFRELPQESLGIVKNFLLTPLDVSFDVMGITRESIGAGQAFTLSELRQEKERRGK